MKSAFKIFALIMAVLCAWAAYVQWNDPDSILWYAVYGVAAIISLLFAFDRLPSGVAFALSLVYLAGMIWDWPSKFEGVTIGNGDIVNIEEGRESLGLLILAVLMLIYALRIRRTRNTS